VIPPEWLAGPRSAGGPGKGLGWWSGAVDGHGEIVPRERYRTQPV